MPASRTAEGERLGGFIYGTIVALAVVVDGARAFPDSTGPVAVLVATTAAVFWCAHVYADGLAHSVSRDERLRPSELVHIARREFSLVQAALGPVVALLLGAVGVLSTAGSYWAAFAFGFAVLVGRGLQFARIERLGMVGTLGVVAGNVAIGLALVGLKIVAMH